MGERAQGNWLKCNKQWERYEGMGMMSTMFYCNQCGKKKNLKNDEIEHKPRGCSCGGRFGENESSVICPYCQGKEVEKLIVGCWD